MNYEFDAGGLRRIGCHRLGCDLDMDADGTAGESGVSDESVPVILLRDSFCREFLP